MIYLQHEFEEYFILIDGHGDFASGVIYEGKEELAEQFQSYAECDGYENKKLTDWSIGDCLTHWGFSLKKFVVKDFEDVSSEDIIMKHLINDIEHIKEHLPEEFKNEDMRDYLV